MKSSPKSTDGSADIFDPYAVYIGGVKCDPQRIARAFMITDMGAQQALKKILRNGHKHKSATEDMREEVSSLTRSIEMDAEDLGVSEESDPAPKKIEEARLDPAICSPVAMEWAREESGKPWRVDGQMIIVNSHSLAGLVSERDEMGKRVETQTERP